MRNFYRKHKKLTRLVGVILAVLLAVTYLKSGSTHPKPDTRYDNVQTQEPDDGTQEDQTSVSDVVKDVTPSKGTVDKIKQGAKDLWSNAKGSAKEKYESSNGDADKNNYAERIGSYSGSVGDEKGQILYKPLDEKGRPVGVKANITQKNMQGDRKNSPELVAPLGWGHNAKVTATSPSTGKTYHGYFWNKSHILAYSLGGSNTDLKNMVTGTRFQNVGRSGNNGGMAYTETQARDYLKAHKDGSVKYEVTCYYNEDEIVPRYSIVDVLSDDGSINESIRVENSMPGFSIDYHTGSFISN